MAVISIANQKGGVGKTTVTLGLAEAAADLGLRVLVIDCDPQANATAGLDVTPGQYTLADILENEVILDSENAAAYIISSGWDLPAGSIDVICSDPRLSHVESLLSSDPIGACDRLDRALAGVIDQYDLVVCDCPPSVGLLTINALFASNSVVIVSAPSAWSTDGVETFTKNVERIASRRDGCPSVAGIIINNVGRTRDARYWHDDIKERFTGEIASISSRAAVAEAAASSSPIAALGSRSGAPEAREEFRNAYLSLIGISTPASGSGILVTATSIATAV